MPKREDEPRPAEGSQEVDAELESLLFWEKNKTAIISGAVALLVIALGVASYFFYSHYRKVEAQDALAQAGTIEEWQQVAKDFSGMSAAGDALLLVARAQREGGDLAASTATYKQVLADYPKYELVGLASLGVAGNLSLEGKTDEAISAFGETALKYSSSYAAPIALLNQAELYLATDEREKALESLTTLSNQFGDSVSTFVSRGQLAAVEALVDASKPVPTPAPEQTSPEPETDPTEPAAAAEPPAQTGNPPATPESDAESTPATASEPETTP